jgi:hypothetical protein
VTTGSSTNTSIAWLVRSAGTSSALQVATPERTGGIGLNQARRMR